MNSKNKIKHTEVDFKSSLVSEARDIVERDLEIIAKRFCMPVHEFYKAYDEELVLVGLFETKCGHSCVFIEYENKQLIAPLDLLQLQSTTIH